MGPTDPKPPDGLLRTARTARGLTVQAVADLVGVSASRVSQVERGEVDGSLRLDTLRRFAAALGYRVRIELLPDPDRPDRPDRSDRSDRSVSLPVLAAEVVGGYVTVRRPLTESPEEVLARLRAEGVLQPATGDLGELPPPAPMTERLREALGGRTLSEVIIADREAEPW